MRKILLILGMCFALLSSAYAQQKVTGKVTDEDGSGIPGVSVVQKGTTKGTITNVDGDYNLDVPGDVTLVFSFVGMMNVEEQVTNRSVIDVAMEVDAIGIDEVVVTALGINRQVKALGYSMDEVEGAEIAQTNTVSPVQALQGKSAGLSIGASDGGLFGNSKIQVRGVSVMNSSNNQPIFVIDGVILENGISNASADWSGSANDYGNILKNLNPDDYESVSVLKGAAATALYGSRGINGAIVIKNKDGKGQRGIGVKFTQSVGVDHVYKQPGLQYEYGPGTLAGYVGYGEKDADGNYYKYDTNQFYTRDVDGSQMLTKIGNPNNGFLWGPKYDGRELEDYDGEIRDYTGFPDAMKDAYDTGISSNTALALSGANDKGSFYLSNSYNYREGTMPTNKFTRNALLFKGSYNLANWLHADASISFTNSSSTNPNNSLGGAFVYGNWAGWYDTNRWNQQDVWQAPHGGTPNNNYGDQYGNVPNNGTWFNLNLDDLTRKEQVTRPIVRLTADVTDWMTLYVEGNMNHYTKNYEKQDLGNGYANNGGSYELRNDLNITRTLKAVANLNKDYGDFTTNLILGGELFDKENEYTRVWTNGGLIVPGQFFMNNSKNTRGSDAKINGTQQINSLYFLASVGWRDQLFLDVTGRNDWSSSMVYTNGTGNYSYFYPSVSSSWIFTETFDLPSAFSFGKLRASWAQVGNDASPYAINKGYSLGNWEIEGGNNIYLNTKSTTLVDPNIKPERKNSFEIGLDLRMFNNRFNLDLAYYNEDITNQISTLPLPSSSGLNNILTNVGTMNNKGFEMSIGGSPVQTKDFEWETTFLYWNNTTTITDLADEVGAYKRFPGSDITYGNFRVGAVAYEDGEYGVLMTDTKPLEDENGNKILTWRAGQRGAIPTRSGVVEEVGKINPDFEGSWDNTFHYKSLTLSILIDARYGGHIASFNNKYGTASGITESSTKWRDEEHGGITWTSQHADTQGQTFNDGMIPDGVFKADQTVVAPNGETVDVGGMSYQAAYEAGYVEPTHASLYTYFESSWSSGVINDHWFNEVKYISLRNVSLGYTLPKSFAQKMKAQNLYVSINARNLAYLYNSLPNDLNPESFRGTSSNASFRERSYTPYTASYTFTLSIDF